MLSSADELESLISTRNDLPFSVLQGNKIVDFTALMCIFPEKLQLAWDCSFACFGPQAAINAGSGRGNICGSSLQSFGVCWKPVQLGVCEAKSKHEKFVRGSAWPRRLIQSLLPFICNTCCVAVPVLEVCLPCKFIVSCNRAHISLYWSWLKCANYGKGEV